MKLKTIAPALLMTTLPANATTCPKNIPLTIKKPEFEINLLDSFCKEKDDSIFKAHFISQQNESVKTPFENNLLGNLINLFSDSTFQQKQKDLNSIKNLTDGFNIQRDIPEEKTFKIKKNIIQIQKGRTKRDDKKLFNFIYEKFILPKEGLYSNNQSDNGGKTYKGITQIVYDNYRETNDLKKQPIALEFRQGHVPFKYRNKTILKNQDISGSKKDVVINISDKQVKEIYYKDFWLKTRCDTMSEDLAVLCFDTSINMGTSKLQSTGMTRCQEFVKSSNGNPDKFIKKRIKTYKKMSNNKEFISNWINRSKDLLKFAKKVDKENNQVDLASIFNKKNI